MTPQEFLNKSCEGLVKQGKPSFVPSAIGSALCRYISREGFRCAVGHCISDTAAKLGDTMADTGEHSLAAVLFSAFGASLPNGLRSLAQDLQSAHDLWATQYAKNADAGLIRSWQHRCQEIAKNHKLEAPACIM